MITVGLSDKTGDVAVVEVDLSGEISGAGLDVPTGPGGLQLSRSCLSEQTVESLPLHHDVLHPSHLPLLHLRPPPDHPGGVEDTQEALSYPGAVRPERFNKTVSHQA